MDILKTASFGTLFTVTFVVAATFQVVMTALGLLLAIFAPGTFNMNGAPAQNPLQAVGVDVFLLVVMLLINVTISAAGAGLWLLVRRFVVKAPASAATAS